MSLASRVKKLQSQGKDVTVNAKQFNLVSFDGYHADDAVKVFWAGAVIFTVIVFFLFWIGSTIVGNQKANHDPAILKLKAEQWEREAKSKAFAKDQYIRGCKDSGAYPTDMGSDEWKWECSNEK